MSSKNIHINFNRMESTGKPGKVHISEKTYQFLKEDYYVEEGDDFLGKMNFLDNERAQSVHTL